jgi:SAM-dependent methyltransferase
MLTDPFTLSTCAPVPGRPRLLSFLGRWGRARRWLPKDALRVLDVGCAFGSGAAAIAARGPAERVVVGVERDPEYLEVGRRRFPWLTIIEGDATALPVPDESADAVLLLDVVEHLAEPERALGEAHRVLRPGGVLVLTIPHGGPRHKLDALNVYQALCRRHPSWPALDASDVDGSIRLERATESGSGMHRHFAPEEIAQLLGPSFIVDRMARTGLGLQEPLTLAALMIRGPLRLPRVYRALTRALFPLWLFVYLADDLVPSGPLAYNLTVRARAAEPGDRP